VNNLLKRATGVLLFTIGVSLAAPVCADTTPDTFTFTPMYNVRRLFPAVEIEGALITGIDQPAPISVINGEYATPSAGWTSGPGFVVNGDIVYVRHTASAGIDTPTTTILTVGGVSAPFTTRTVRRSALTMGAVRDFNGDGHADMIWRNEVTGDTTVWLLDDAFRLDGRFLDSAMWVMNGLQLHEGAMLVLHSDWRVALTSDLDGNGRADLVWYRPSTAENFGWLMDGLVYREGRYFHPAMHVPIAAADFNGDGKTDVFYETASWGVVAMLYDGLSELGHVFALYPATRQWRSFADFDGDGRVDTVFLDTASNPQTTFVFFGNWSYYYPGAYYGAALISDPNWRLL